MNRRHFLTTVGTALAAVPLWPLYVGELSGQAGEGSADFHPTIRIGNSDMSVILTFRPDAGDPAPKIVRFGPGVTARQVFGLFRGDPVVYPSPYLPQALTEIGAGRPIGRAFYLSITMAYAYQQRWLDARHVPAFARVERFDLLSKRKTVFTCEFEADSGSPPRVVSVRRLSRSGRRAIASGNGDKIHPIVARPLDRDGFNRLRTGDPIPEETFLDFVEILFQIHRSRCVRCIAQGRLLRSKLLNTRWV